MFAIIVAAVFLLITFIGVNSWSLLAFFALLPVLLSGFAVYTTRKDGKAQGACSPGSRSVSPWWR